MFLENEESTVSNSFLIHFKTVFSSLKIIDGYLPDILKAFSYSAKILTSTNKTKLSYVFDHSYGQ